MITVRTVNALPDPLGASTLYFVKSAAGSTMSIYMTNKEASVAFSAQAFDLEAVQAFIATLRNQPDGLVGIEHDSLISTSIGLNAQDMPLLGPSLDYVWTDLEATFVTTPTGKANNPSLGVIYGNFQGLIFSKDTMNQVWVDYHIDHDIALNTKLYPHVHWMPLTNAAGTVRWGFEYAIAKGHGQQAFSGSTTVYVNQSFPSNSQYKHMVAEVSEIDAILSANIEPDSFIKMRVFRDATHAIDTYNSNVHAWCCDLHHQVARIGTKNKSPNFYL